MILIYFNGCISIFSLDNGAGNSEHPNPLAVWVMTVFWSSPSHWGNSERAKGVMGGAPRMGQSEYRRMLGCLKMGVYHIPHKMVVEWGKMMVDLSIVPGRLRRENDEPWDLGGLVCRQAHVYWQKAWNHLLNGPENSRNLFYNCGGGIFSKIDGSTEISWDQKE